MTVRSDDGLGFPPGDADAPLDVAETPAILTETPSSPRHEPRAVVRDGFAAGVAVGAIAGGALVLVVALLLRDRARSRP